MIKKYAQRYLRKDGSIGVNHITYVCRSGKRGRPKLNSTKIMDIVRSMPADKQLQLLKYLTTE